MNNQSSVSNPANRSEAAWADLFRDGRGIYSTLVIMGVALHALQILIIAIVMPTVVADIGGADYYTWPAMLYTIGSIIGAASVGPVWNLLGVKGGYGCSAFAFVIGTIICALAPDMLTLNIGRGLQGFGSGLVIGGGMALVSAVFSERLRKRILAAYQGVWMVAQLLGPAVGGVFAQLGWWRGSFWTMVPIILIFAFIAVRYLPERLSEEQTKEEKISFPFFRLLILTSGVFCIALAGPVENSTARLALIVSAIAIIWFAFKLDKKAKNRLYPKRALSLFSPVGLALWIMLLVGMVHTTVPLLIPLLLQVVHGVEPLFVSFVSLVISLGWTIGTFAVSGWTGKKETIALGSGPLLMMLGLLVITVTAQLPMLITLTVAAGLFGFGVGIHNVHLLSRTMEAAEKGEEQITASSMPSIRSLGTAFGAALAGLLTQFAGLGTATKIEEVGPAITFSYGCGLIPIFFATGLMFWLLHITKKP